MNPSGSQGCKVVARMRDGRVLKGTTRDFSPMKPKFHLEPAGDVKAEPLQIQIGALKALFFVKDYDGDASRRDDPGFDPGVGQGRKILVMFEDGERISGYTNGYSPDKPGFFVVPADPRTNNERIFVSREAVKRVEWVTREAAARS